MRSSFVGPHDPLWSEVLARTPHDIYHLPGYARVSAGQDGGEPLAFVAEEGESRLLIPLVIRRIESNDADGLAACDATCPYGYPSPLLAGAAGPEAREAFLGLALERLLADLRRQDIVAVFLRLHPLLPLPLRPFARQGTLVPTGKTVYIDLARSEEQLWRQTRSQFRTRINRAKRLGYRAEIDGQWDRLDDFIEAYTETMRRVEAEAYYFFPPQYFLDLRDAIRGRLHLAVVHIRGDVACAGLFSEVGGIVQMHLAGQRSEYLADQPMKLLLHFVRGWAKDRGNRVFHLGGGVGGHQDSLLHFKKGFSDLLGDYYTWRAIADVDAYDALVRQWRARGGTETDPPGDFFPAYRRPLPLASQPAPAIID